MMDEHVVISFFSLSFAGSNCVFKSPAHLHSSYRCQHGRGLGQGSGEGPTLQLQGNWDGQQVHHPDVRKHHKWAKLCLFIPTCQLAGTLSSVNDLLPKMIWIWISFNVINAHNASVTYGL